MEANITETIRKIKQRFFAMRNGMLGEQMRRMGTPYRIIFGLNVPQIADIARSVSPSRELAEALWANTSTRESMLIAPMVMPVDEFTLDDARRWIASSPAIETTDNLCHKLLRNVDNISTIIPSLLADDVAEPLVRYGAIRLMFNLLNDRTAPQFKPLAEREAGSQGPTAQIAAMLLDEIIWICEEKGC